MPGLPAAWLNLRRFTPARVALGRVGNAIPTTAHLAFQEAHAAARDAVHAVLDVAFLQTTLGRDSLVVHSACPDRHTYLLRPDLGRRLAPQTSLPEVGPGEIACVLCDGLSATAVQRHAAGVVKALGDTLAGPIIIGLQGRVALGDDIGERLGAAAVVVLIGERPGLSTPDSLGAYLTWAPRRGRTDAERNCISNIRPEGLPIPAAAAKLQWLIARMTQLRLSGVGLKDEQPRALEATKGPDVALGAPDQLGETP